MAYFVLGFALLAGLLLISKWYTTVDARTLLRALRWVAIGLLSAFTIVLLASGRLGLALGAAAFLFPWAMQAMRSIGRSGYATGGPAGEVHSRTSAIRTRFLHMSLNHESGRLEGEIIDGPEVGSRLCEMSQEALITLLGTYNRLDPQSAQVLAAYLDRINPHWREAGHARQDDTSDAGAASGKQGAMSRMDALRVLGLEPGTSDDEVRAAYHRLIAGLHPDRGGSGYLAAQVNRARDTLLRR